MIARRGRQACVTVYPPRFGHHFSHTWLDRGGPEGDLMELGGTDYFFCSGSLRMISFGRKVLPHAYLADAGPD